MSEQENTNTTYEKIGQMIAIRNSIKDVVNSKDGESISDDTPFDEYAGIIIEKLSLKNELCKLTFSPNGGTGANFEYKNMIPNKSSVILPTYSGVKRGHTLSNSGWGKTPSSGQDTYAYGSTYDVVGNETFYAQWTKNKYNLSWDTVGMKNCGFTVDGESVNAPGTKEVEFEAGVELKCTPDEGYNFYKWDGNGIPPEGSKTSEKLKFQMPSNDVKELKPNVGIKKAVISYQLYARYYGLLDQFSEYKRKFDIYLGYSQEFDIKSKVPVSEETGYGYIIFIPENCMISEFTAYTETDDEEVVKTTLAYSDFVNIEDTGGQSLSEPFMTIGMVKDGSETPEYVRTVELGGENYRIYAYKGKETDKIISVEYTVYFSVTNSEPYLYRTTAGSADIADGVASIGKVKGNSLVWNQLVQNNDDTYTNVGATMAFVGDSKIVTITGTPSLTGQAAMNHNIKPTIVNGHKFLLFVRGEANSLIRFRQNDNQPEGQRILIVEFTNTVNPIIFSSSVNGYVDFVIGLVESEALNIKFVYNVYDLTKMFGAGNEPASVEEFEAMFPLDYYEYNAGEVLTLNATGIKTIGFNAYDHSTGKAVLIGGNEYQITGTYTSISYEDINGNAETITPDSDGKFTPTNNGTLSVVGGNSTDTCVHLVWSGKRDGEYEQYWEHTRDIPIAKINTDGTITDSADGKTRLFSDGLCKAGNAYDEITSTKAIKRIGKVDLGTLDWTYNSEYSGFYKRITGSKPNFKAVCAKYTYKGNYSYVNDKECGYIFNTFLFIKDSSFGTDTAALKAALNGVFLYYELETPIEVTFAEPINLNYQVSDFGTEEIIPDNTITTDPKTAPFAHETMYWFDTYNNTHRTIE